VSDAIGGGRLLLGARWLLPVSAPPVEDGALLVEGGRIVAMGRRRDLLAAAGRTPLRDLGECALMPAPVNAHIHLELGWAAGRLPRGEGLAAWVRALLEQRGALPPGREEEAAREGVRTCLDSGTAAVGEVANTPASLPALAGSGLEGILFREVLGTEPSEARAILSRAWDEALTVSRSDPALLGAVTAHAPHTLSDRLLEGVARLAAEAGTPLSVHCAESEEELRLLREGDGPLAELLEERGFPLPPKGSTPLRRLAAAGLLGERTLLVHGVHLDEEETTLAAEAGATVVLCPRSNAALGVGRAPVPRLLEAGVPLALGTDSLGSNDDLDLFAEMAALRRDHPGLDPAVVLRAATLGGARALGLAGLGRLERGCRAALAWIEIEPGEDPVEVATSEPARPRGSSLPG
jgi:cytosine/adenosine deaminase-related metal-dependent hydrolase